MSLVYNKDIPGEDRDLFRTYLRRNRSEITRERDNWRLYDGTDYGQWSEQNIASAVQEGRPLSTYNFAKKFIDTTVGALIADPFENSYDTELGDDVQAAMLLNELFLEDKDLLKWDPQVLQFTRAGFIFRGYLQIYIDREKDKRGRIGLRYIHGDKVTSDPDRQTMDINSNKDFYTHAWMSAQQIKDKYDIDTEEINTLIRLYENQETGTVSEGTGTSSDGSSNAIYDRSAEFYDDKNGLFLVLDRYTLKKTKYFDVYDPSEAAVLCTKPKDEAELLADSMRVLGKEVKLIPHFVKECRVRTTCPAMSLKMVLEEGKYELQLDRYPFFEFSSDQINGRPNTYADILKDPSVAFNKRENTATHILMTTVNNALLIEEDAVDGDEDRIKKIGKTRNRPGAYFKVSPGTISGNKIKHLDHGTPPNDFLNAASHIRDIFNDLTPAVPAMQATSSKNDSGVLFQSKVQQAMIAMQIPTKLLKGVWEDIGDAYFMAAKQVYTYPMKFVSSRTKEVFYLNVEGGINMRTIPRLRVNVSQSPTSETYRRRLIQNYLAIAQYMQNSPFTLATLQRIVLGALPDIPKAELEQLQEAAKLEADAQEVMLMAQVQQAQAQGAPPGQGNPAGPGDSDPEGILNSVLSKVQGQPSLQGG